MLNAIKLSGTSHLFGQLGILASIGSLLALFWSFTLFLGRIQQIRHEIEMNALKYQMISERVWQKMHPTGEENIRTLRRFGRDIFSRQQKPIGADFKGLAKCEKCTRLACPLGPIGPAGMPGGDGQPGIAGNVGRPGTDGQDIQEDPLPPLPCIVCPAGPTGSRGPQGERGLYGPSGPKGMAGPAGQPGRNGPMGNYGPAGGRGKEGAMGNGGPPGDIVIGGIGVKGPIGSPGQAGSLGLPGLAGRPSNIAGQTGKQGPEGVKGQPGEPGQYGPPGHQGPPGDVGYALAACPIFCNPNFPQQMDEPVRMPLGYNNNREFGFPWTLMSHDPIEGEEGEEHYDSLEEEKIVTIIKNKKE